MKKAKNIIFVFLLSFGLFCSMSLPILAAPTLMDQQIGFSDKAGDTSLGEPFGVVGGKPSDIRIIVAKTIKALLGLLGIVLLAYILVAGYKYMTAAGNQEQAKSAIKHIQYAIIGLLIILSAFILTNFVINSLQGIGVGGSGSLINAGT